MKGENLTEKTAYPKLDLPGKTLDSLFAGAAIELPMKAKKLEIGAHYDLGNNLLGFVQGTDEDRTKYILHIYEKV